MADQATLRGGGSPAQADGEAPERRVVGGIAEFANDITTLMELQWKLARLDFKEAMRRAIVPIALVLVGTVFLLAALPVLLLGVAGLVAAGLKISNAWATVLTGGVVIVLSAVLAGVSATLIGPRLSTFRRSSEELSRNLAWIRTVLLYSGRTAPPRRR